MNTVLPQRALALMALSFALLGSGAAHAHESQETIQPVMRQAVPEAKDAHVLMITVSYAPGAASSAHLHPGSIFAYVLEGSVVSQLAGEEPKIYTAGQSWYEPPGAQHLVSKNASQTQPAKLLVWAINGDGTPVKKPLPQ